MCPAIRPDPRGKYFCHIGGWGSEEFSDKFSTIKLKNRACVEIALLSE